MVLAVKPNVLPSALDYIPAGAVAVKPTPKDSWWTLAEYPGVKQAKMSALDLCEYNFKTRKPTEINWYMHAKLGCTRTTQDGKNYMFGTSDSPGIVYIPPLGTPPDPVPKPVLPGVPVPVPRSDVWMGIGVKAGMMGVVAGIETLGGAIMPLDDSRRYIGIAGQVFRLGLGVGVGAGVVILIATGVNNPSDLQDLETLEKDFNVSLGAKLGQMLKSTKLAKLKPFIEMLLKLGARTPGGLKAALAAHPDKWVELYKNAQNLKSALGINPGDPPSFMVIEIPGAGGGTELSVFYGLTRINVVDSGVL